MLTGRDVQAWRTRVGLSVRGLAKLLRVDDVTVFRWISGRSGLSPRNQAWMQVLIFETARRQKRRHDMSMCPVCRWTGLIPRNVDTM
jgi:hypothetical protein